VAGGEMNNEETVKESVKGGLAIGEALRGGGASGLRREEEIAGLAKSAS
jgi:hypothetical protein